MLIAPGYPDRAEVLLLDIRRYTSCGFPLFIVPKSMALDEIEFPYTAVLNGRRYQLRA